MNKRILILGGGLAGCVAAKFFLDKGTNVTIVDRQEIGKSFVVAKNHVSFHAHEKMWCATQPVKVVKKIHGVDNLEQARAMYRAKVYGEHSVEKVSINWDTKYSFLLDTNVILEAIKRATVIEGEIIAIHGNEVTFKDKSGARHIVGHDLLISTLSLTSVCRFMKLNPSSLHHTPIGIRFYPIPTLDYMLIEYFPGKEPYYRRTSFRTQASEEYLLNKDYAGITLDAKIFPGKIVPNPETEALVERLDRMGIYQIGRFAQWKPKMFVNHIVPELERRVPL